jgi:hypothetical protein
MTFTIGPISGFWFEVIDQRKPNCRSTSIYRNTIPIDRKPTKLVVVLWLIDGFVESFLNFSPALCYFLFELCIGFLDYYRMSKNGGPSSSNETFGDTPFSGRTLKNSVRR